jgi:hypothetical protein
MAKNQLKNNEVAVINNVNQITVPKSQDDIPQTIADLKEVLKQKKGNAPEEVSLDINYSYTPGIGNIKDITSLRTLAAISASIKARAKAQDEELEHFGINLEDVVPFTESSKTVAEWELIISKAIYEIKNKVEIQNLEEAISQLEKHLSAEEQLKKTLAGITSSVTKKLA